MDKTTQVFRCPLCESLLTREKWIKITGQWDERQKLLEERKKEIENHKKTILQAEKDKKLIAKKAELLGLEKGVKKERAERIKMSKMLQNRTKEIDLAHKTIKELQKQIKEGKTPQSAGFDYEKEVTKILSENFPEDEIKPTGKMGDNIQFVKFNGEIAGSILYECKKTSKYDNSFVLEIRRHQETAGCTYAVVVTHAVKNGKSKFFVEGNVIVIDPLGLLDIALWLRSTIIEMHQLKLTKEEINQKSKEILKYMQSGIFKNRMTLAIQKSEEAYNILMEEIKDHKKLWQRRYDVYASIHANVQTVRAEIGKIITGNRNLIAEVKKLPMPE